MIVEIELNNQKLKFNIENYNKKNFKKKEKIEKII